MKKISLFISLLIDILDCAEQETHTILNGGNSQWELEKIQKVILPEISELLSYANSGVVYFKYGKKQRLLESSYLLTDSLSELLDTALGKSIIKLQDLYDVL